MIFKKINNFIDLKPIITINSNRVVVNIIFNLIYKLNISPKY